MSDRFYTPAPLTLGDVVLDGSEAHHLAAVRRFATGDRVVLFNGDGCDYPAEIVDADRKQVILRVVDSIRANREIGFPLVIGVAFPKGDRGDFLVEKLTELGCTRLIPLTTARSIVHPKESRLDKLRHAVIEASKQCGRNVLMRIDPLTPLNEFAVAASSFPPLSEGEASSFSPPLGGGALMPTLRVVLTPSDEKTHAARSLNGLREFTDAITRYGIWFAIGPEGGFTVDELAELAASCWIPAGLGERILRVETAAIASAGWAATLAISNLSDEP